jgi:hypothetical protein
MRNELSLAATPAERVPCFEFDSSSLDAPCAAVEAVLQTPIAPSSALFATLFGSG